ncbi:hypothetical protein BDR04DRAFT_132203 [Suillus decipiens]|nr:hypothetical protein BDR04DRAFT_132203 [Suillus decipiens]
MRRSSPAPVPLSPPNHPARSGDARFCSSQFPDPRLRRVVEQASRLTCNIRVHIQCTRSKLESILIRSAKRQVRGLGSWFQSSTRTDHKQHNQIFGRRYSRVFSRQSFLAASIVWLALAIPGTGAIAIAHECRRS